MTCHCRLQTCSNKSFDVSFISDQGSCFLRYNWLAISSLLHLGLDTILEGSHVFLAQLFSIRESPVGVASSIVLSTLANMKGELSVDCSAAGRCFYTLRVFKPRLKVKGVPFCHCNLPSSSYIKHVLHSCTEDSLYYPWQLPAPLVSPHYMMWPLLPCVWAASCLSPPSAPAAWHWSPIILWRHQYLLICTWHLASSI